MAVGYGVAVPKGDTRKRVKGRKRRRSRAVVKTIRALVFERERHICRCCGVRWAWSMHELVARSLGGKVSMENSIAVCGDGTRGCHGLLQRHEITYQLKDDERGAESDIAFFAQTRRAQSFLAAKVPLA